MANLLPQPLFESAWFNNQIRLVVKQENIMGEKQRSGNFGQQSITLMLFRVLLHAVILRHGTDGFTFSLKEVHTADFYHHKNSPSSARPEPATERLMGPVTSTLTTRPPWVARLKTWSMVCCLLIEENWYYFLQWNDSRRMLPGIGYEFNLPFGSW
jgi:hypothetical protein